MSTSIWESVHSFVPWHTSHRVNVDAKGVPQEIKISVSGLPNVRHIGVDVTEITRNALVCVLYSLALLLTSLSIYLLISAGIQLVGGVYVASVYLVSGAALLIAMMSAYLQWVGFWNVVMLSYLVIIDKSEHIQSCKCLYAPLKGGGKLPLCGIVWLICVAFLLIQIFMKVGARFMDLF